MEMALNRLQDETDLQRVSKHIDHDRATWESHIEKEHGQVKYVGRHTVSLAVSDGNVVGLWDEDENTGYVFGRL